MRTMVTAVVCSLIAAVVPGEILKELYTGRDKYYPCDNAECAPVRRFFDHRYDCNNTQQNVEPAAKGPWCDRNLRGTFLVDGVFLPQDLRHVVISSSARL
jgi:hypothetical protein